MSVAAAPGVRPAALSPRLASALAGAVLLALIGLAFIGQSPDFENYAEYFSVLRSSDIADIAEQRFEPLFAALALPLARLLPSDVAVLSMLAGLAFFLKWQALARLSASRKVFWIAGALYVVRFAPLHELTQIRIAIALAFWLLSIVHCRSRAFWFLLLICPLTHYSTLVLLPFSLAWRRLHVAPQHFLRHERRFWLTLLVVVAATGVALKILIEPLASAFAILDLYSNIGFGDDPVNLLSIGLLVDVVFLVWAVLLRDGGPELRFWLWTQTIGIATFVALRDFPVLAHRMHEMLNLSWVLYVAAALPRRGLRGWHARLYVVVCVPLYIYLHVFSNNAILAL